MANFDVVAQLVAASVAPDKPDYLVHAQRALELIWSRTVAAYDWWFTRAAEPLPLDLQPNVTRYNLTQKELGSILCIGTDLARPLYAPMAWIEWQRRMERQGTVTDYFTVASPSPAPVSGAVFTVAGRSADSMSILVQPTPSVAVRRYVWYQMAGSKANFGNCPDSLVPCLIHGAKAIAAPPKALDIPGRRSQWESHQLMEHQMYISELDAAAVREQAARIYEQPAYAEGLTADRIEEVNAT